jgi:hypothetical protein
MFSSQTAQLDWALYQRVARSLAHSVGNSINVVWGRLSLLERDAGLNETSLAHLERARARLKTLQEELMGALNIPPMEGFVGEPVRDLLESLRKELDIELRNQEVLKQDDITFEGASELALRCLENACRVLDSSRAPVWELGSCPVRDRRALTLTALFDSTHAPPERKALMEPWFSEDTHTLDGQRRHGRLLLARALGLLEESGVRLHVERLGSTVTGVTLTWRPAHA